MANLVDTGVNGDLRVTGNIYGNLSGNATTATTWATGREFKIQDADATNTGTTVTGVNGSGNVTLKLPSTIKATLTGNATTCTYPYGFASRNTSNKWGTLSDSTYTWVTDWRTSDGSEIAFGSKSGQLSAQIDGYFYQREGNNRVLDTSDGMTCGLCSTAAGTAAKVVSAMNYTASVGNTILVRFTNTNSAAGALTLNLGGVNKTIKWNGTVTASGTTSAIPAGTWPCYYDGTYWNIWTDSTIPGGPYMGGLAPFASIESGNANRKWGYIGKLKRTNLAANTWGSMNFIMVFHSGASAYTPDTYICNFEASANHFNGKLTLLNGSAALTQTATLHTKYDSSTDSWLLYVYSNTAKAWITCKIYLLSEQSDFFTYNTDDIGFLESAPTDVTEITRYIDGYFSGSITDNHIVMTDGTTGLLKTTGTLAIGNGGTGANTRLGALKALTNESVGTNATYFLTITNSWGKGGYTSVAEAKTVLGLGSAAYMNTGTSGTTVALGNHAHGSITNGGAITDTAVALASGDSLAFVDSSDSSKIKKTSITFDGSTATKALTQKGTWETFNNYSHPAGSAPSKTGVPTANATPGFGGTFKVNQITTDSTSHVSAVTERTITIPNATATTSAAGLMSVSDYNRLNGSQNIGEHDADACTTTGFYYGSSNMPSTSLGWTERSGGNDGALFVQAYSTSWVGQIGQDYRTGNLFVRGKNNGTYTDWKRIPYLTVKNRGGTTTPVYVDTNGEIQSCTTYAGGTAVTLNNSSKAGSTASFYAPTAGGTANYVLIGNGTTSAPTWTEKAPKAVVADYPAGFTDRLTSWSWGTLTTGNGYTQLSSWKTSGGGQMAFAKNTESGSDDALSVQIDGTFYQHEGKHKVLDAADVSVPSTVPTLAWNTESTLATIDGKNIKVKLPASPDTDTKVTQTADDVSTGTGFELLFSATGDNTTRTEASRKSSKLTYQPSTGTIKSTAYNVNSKCTLQFNTTTNALDFVFA